MPASQSPAGAHVTPAPVVSLRQRQGRCGQELPPAAFARELLTATPTLLINLDFSYRGLSGLITSSDTVASLEPPDFLDAEDTTDMRWDIVVVGPYFGDKPLLALLPLDINLTKEFERTPFLTSVFPHSLLTRKTHLLLCDLFH